MGKGESCEFAYPETQKPYLCGETMGLSIKHTFYGKRTAGQKGKEKVFSWKRGSELVDTNDTLQGQRE